MSLELQGRRALVTGGGRGIGKAIARVLAEEGADVALLARSRDQLEASAQEIAAATGRRVIAVVADTRSRVQVEAAVASAVEQLGGLDILVNSAAPPGGLSSATRVSEILDEEAWADVDIKVLGYLRTARAATPYLIANGWGRIINIGGLSVRKTGRPVATLRNAGVVAITKSLADELGPKGINVNVVHPGSTRTERTQAEDEQRAAASNSIGRIVDAREVAWVVAFLASPKSVAINGDSIGVGGGSPGWITY